MNYNELYALGPSFLLGLFCGIASYFRGFVEDINYKPSLRRALGNALYSAILSLIIFAFLDSFALSFMTKLAISSLVAFIGLDKALDILFKLRQLR